MSTNVASAPLTPFSPDAVIQCARLPRKFVAGDSLQPCSHDPVQQGFGFARLRDCFGLFVRRFRRERCDDFLEARIAAERIPEGQRL